MLEKSAYSVESPIGALDQAADVSGYGHARSFEDTYGWVRHRLRRIPITRVFDMTPLDTLGLPVYSAVTPLAKDLTVHAGKGPSAIAARVSAIMEAIERTCAESVASKKVRRRSYDALLASGEAATPLDPNAFDLPFGTPYDARQPISWVMGVDLIGNRQVWVPLDLVLSPAQDEISSGVDTNGLASGNTFTEAVVHGLYEVIERDAVASAYFVDAFCADEDQGRLPITMIDTATVTGLAREWIQRVTRAGCEVYIRDVTSEVGVRVYHVRLIAPEFPGGARGFAGYGASLSAERALLRAITEAVQSHTGHLLGNRDQYEAMGGTSDRDHRILRTVSTCWPDRLCPFVPSPSDRLACAELHSELWTVVSKLRDAGCRQCVVVDLTRKEIEVPVVRVLVPSLSTLYGLSKRRPGLKLLRFLV